MLRPVCLVMLVFTLRCFEWLLFLLFEVLVECAIYVTGRVGFCRMYSAILSKAIIACIVISFILMVTFGCTGQ